MFVIYRIPSFVRFGLRLTFDFGEIDCPYFKLREVMRMATGLEIIWSVLFYGELLKARIGTTLRKRTRTLSKSLTEANWIASSFSTDFFLDLLDLISKNIAAPFEAELTENTSRTDLHNTLAFVNHFLWLFEHKAAQPDQVGIATP